MGNLCHIKFWRCGGMEAQPGEDKESGAEWNIDRRQLIKRERKKKTNKSPRQYKGEPPSAVSQVTRRERRNNVRWSVFPLGGARSRAHANDERVLLPGNAGRRVKTSRTFKSSPNYPDISFTGAAACFPPRKTGGWHKSRQRP